MNEIIAGSVSDLDLTFDDLATTTQALNSRRPMTLKSGVYRPVEVVTGYWFLPPAPPHSTNRALSIFNGTSATGTWSLYIQTTPLCGFTCDGPDNPPGVIARGWSLQFSETTASERRAFGEVNGEPVITQQPVSASVCPNGSVTFRTAASGDGLTYQWRKNGVPFGDGVPYLGAQSPILNIATVTANETGSYDVVVSNSCGQSVTSSSATLSTGGPPVVLSQSPDVTLCASGSATISGVTSNASSWQWLHNNLPISDGPSYSGTRTPTLTINSAGFAEHGTYRLFASNGCTEVSGAVTNVTVLEPPAITSAPDITSCEGSFATLSVTATGDGLTYRWYRDGAPVVDGGRITGSNSAVLVIANAQPSDAGNYTVFIDGTCHVPLSADVNLSIVSPVVITAQPAGAARCPSFDDLQFHVAASAAGSGVNFQWRKNGMPLSDDATYAGTHTDTLTLSQTLSSEAGTYDVVASGLCGLPVTSNPAVLTVGATPVIRSVTGPPSNTCPGATVTFNAVADGAGVTYRWQRNGIDLADDGHFSGVHTPTLTIHNVAVADEGTIGVVVENGCGETNGGTASAGTSLSLLRPPSIAQQPISQRVCAGASKRFDVHANTPFASTPTYRWRKNGNTHAVAHGLAGRRE
jgi:hypothetical protein